MKYALTALIAFLTLQTSFASAMSPVRPQESSIAELRVGGGMPVPGGLGSRLLWITNNGDVFVQEKFYGKNFDNLFENGIEREYLLGNLSQTEIRELTDAVTAIRGGGLQKANGHQCMDAPGYSYGAVKGATILTVFTRFGCRESQLKDKAQRPQALIIKAYLDAWNKVAQQ